MKLEGLNIEVMRLPGAMPVFGADVVAAHWSETCRGVAAHGGRLIALWGSDADREEYRFEVNVALAVRDGLVVLSLPLAGTSYPDLSAIFPAAARMQRAAHDLLGITAEGAVDQRKWLRHAA